MTNPTIAARFAAIIASSTGADVAGCTPAVYGDTLVFETEPQEANLVQAAMRKLHGVDVTVNQYDADEDGPATAFVRISLAALTARLAALQAA